MGNTTTPPKKQWSSTHGQDIHFLPSWTVQCHKIGNPNYCSCPAAVDEMGYLKGRLKIKKDMMGKKDEAKT